MKFIVDIKGDITGTVLERRIADVVKMDKKK